MSPISRQDILQSRRSGPESLPPTISPYQFSISAAAERPYKRHGVMIIMFPKLVNSRLDRQGGNPILNGLSLREILTHSNRRPQSVAQTLRPIISVERSMATPLHAGDGSVFAGRDRRSLIEGQEHASSKKRQPAE